MATSLIKIRQIDQTELSGYVQQLVVGAPTSSGSSFNSNIIPSASGVYNLGSTGSYWKNVYANQINLPSGSGVYFGNQFFTTSGNSLLISGPGGTTAISSTTNYVTYVGPTGPTGPTGASGAIITGVVNSGGGMIYFVLNNGSSTNSIQLPSGATGSIGPTGASGISVTGAVSGVNSTGTYFRFLFSNNSTGTYIYVPSGVQGADGDVGGVTLNFLTLTGLFSGQSNPYVSVDGLSGTFNGGPDINLIKGFSYKFNSEGINSLNYTNTASAISDKSTNFIIYGANDTGANSKYVNGTIQNGAGATLTGIQNSGVLLFTIFDNNAVKGRYIWKEAAAGSLSTVSGYVIDPTGIFENYSYLADYVAIGATGYNFYWKSQGTLKFSDYIADQYKYGFALYNADSLVDPPVIQDLQAYYVLGNLNLSYAPLAGPKGATGPSGIPGPAGPSGIAGSIGATGVGVSGVNTIIGGGGILSGFQLVLTNGQSVGPYMIPTGGPQGAAGATGPTGPIGATGISVTGVTQLSSSTINFGLSNSTSTNTVTLPAGPKGQADLYYSYFDPINLRISGLTLTGFQVSTNGTTWTNATGNLRNLSTSQYVKIYNQPTEPFTNRSYSNSQKIIFSRRNTTGEFFGGIITDFNNASSGYLTFYINPQVGYWTNNGLNILSQDGSTIDLNLGSVESVGPTGVSVTGVSGYSAIVNGEVGTTGVKFLFSDNSSSQIFPMPQGPRGYSGAANIFRVSGISYNSSSNNGYLTGHFGNADLIEYNITGAIDISFSINSGTVVTGQTCSVLMRNSGFSGLLNFVPTNQFYFVNSITPIAPQANLAFNIYTFVRGSNYNSHPVYYCTYAANYPALN